MRRGNETKEHLELKRTVGQMLFKKGLMVMYELLDTDILAIKVETGLIIGVEIERTTRNVKRNLERNFKNGADQVLVVIARKNLRVDTEKIAHPFNGEGPIMVRVADLSSCRSAIDEILELDPRKPRSPIDNRSTLKNPGGNQRRRKKLMGG